jgi:WD40 repeat protein
MVFSSSKNNLVRQLRGPTEGTDGIVTIGDKLAAISKNNHVYIWQWNDLSVWPVVARLLAQTIVPVTGDKIIYSPSSNLEKLILTNLKADSELSSLYLSYGAECKKIKMSQNGRYGAVSVLFKEGVRKRWFELGLFDSDLKNIFFVFQRNMDAENFLLCDFDITNDGSLLAGAGGKDQAWIFVTDVNNENVLWEKTFDEYGRFTSVGFSPDGKILFVSEKVRFIISLDSATGQTFRVYEMPKYSTPAHQKQNISCIAVSPDGKILAADTEPAGEVWFWDIASGREIGRISASELTVSDIAFSPDSKKLATGCMVSPEIKIWKVPQPKP